MFVVCLWCINEARQHIVTNRWWVDTTRFSPAGILKLFIHEKFRKSFHFADSTRMLFATWWIFITILTSFYTANLTAFLTLSRFTLPINTLEDIVKKEKPFVTYKGGCVEYAIKNVSAYALKLKEWLWRETHSQRNESLTNLNQMVLNKRVEFTTEKNDSDTLIRYVEKKNYVFVRDRPAMDYLVYQDYKFRKTYAKTDERAQCPFALAKHSLLKRKRAFAYRSDTKWDQLLDPV